MGRGSVMTGSTFRWNVAADLSIASAADIKARRYMPTPLDVTSVNSWIRSCSVAWIVCRTAEDLALDVAQALKDCRWTG